LVDLGEDPNFNRRWLWRGCRQSLWLALIYYIGWPILIVATHAVGIVYSITQLPSEVTSGPIVTLLDFQERWGLIPQPVEASIMLLPLAFAALMAAVHTLVGLAGRVLRKRFGWHSD